MFFKCNKQNNSLNNFVSDPVYAAAFMEQNLSAQNAEHTEEGKFELF